MLRDRVGGVVWDAASTPGWVGDEEECLHARPPSACHQRAARGQVGTGVVIFSATAGGWVGGRAANN